MSCRSLAEYLIPLAVLLSAARPLPSAAAAAPWSGVAYRLSLPDQPEGWHKPVCEDAGLPIDGVGAWACYSSAAFTATGPDVPAQGLVRVALSVIYVSPGLDPRDSERQRSAAAYYAGALLQILPPGPLPPGTRLELRRESGTADRAHPPVPLTAATADDKSYYQLSVDFAAFQEWDAGRTYQIAAVAPDGHTLGSWTLPRERAADTLHQLVAARRIHARQDVQRALADLPSAETRPTLLRAGSTPEYPNWEQDRGHDAIVITRCRLQSDGTTAGCRNLLVLGGHDFGNSTLAWLGRTRFNLPSDGEPTPRMHVFLTIFAPSEG